MSKLITDHLASVESIYLDVSWPQAIDWWAGHNAKSEIDVAISNARHLDATRQQIENELWRRIIQPGSRVLDCACGRGYFSGRLRSAVSEDVSITGIDLSGTILSVAHSEQPWLKLVQSDAASMPFPDEHFDTVMFISAIEQVPKAIVGSALKEVARVLKPGGMLYLVIHKEYIDPFVVPTAIRYLWEQLHKFGISLAKRNKRTVGFDGTLTEIRTMVEEYLHQVQLSCVERRALMTKFDWAFYKRLSPQLAQQMIPVGAALNALPLNYYKDLEYWLYQKK